MGGFMAKSQPFPEPVANWALASLPRADYEQLFPEMELVSLNFGEVLHDAVMLFLEFSTASRLARPSGVVIRTKSPRRATSTGNFLGASSGPLPPMPASSPEANPTSPSVIAFS